MGTDDNGDNDEHFSDYYFGWVLSNIQLFPITGIKLKGTYANDVARNVMSGNRSESVKRFLHFFG